MLGLFKDQLAASVNLTVDQVAVAVSQLLDDAVPVVEKADFLDALARKGETPPEIAAFARELGGKSIVPPIPAAMRTRPLLDVCGTGGDRLNTFNISTTVAILCAAAGVAVAKHGNRAITSQAGSADVLETLGIPVDLSPESAVQSLAEHDFAFFFAPNFHPAFKHLAPARRLSAERGHRTIFNYLGPLLNPAKPSAQLMGVSRPELCPTLAEVLKHLGVQRAMVVSGQVGNAWLDELSTLGDNTVAEFYHDRGFATSTISPHHFPLQPALLADLTGGNRAANAEIIRRLLRNEELGPKRDAVLLNAGAALFVAGSVKSIGEGWELAAELLANGVAYAKLKSLAVNAPRV